MGNNPSHFKGPRNPVEWVKWEGCQQFLARLTTTVDPQKGKFVLPTEAQWEYACRAGSTTRFSFGDDEAMLDDYAWSKHNSDGMTHRVGLKKANAFGLYDMHGNVSEWCQDWFDGDYYATSPMDDPRGPATGEKRVCRGGNWYGHVDYCHSASRSNGIPDLGHYYIGFRVALIQADR